MSSLLFHSMKNLESGASTFAPLWTANKSSVLQFRLPEPPCWPTSFPSPRDDPISLTAELDNGNLLQIVTQGKGGLKLQFKWPTYSCNWQVGTQTAHIFGYILKINQIRIKYVSTHTKSFLHLLCVRNGTDDDQREVEDWVCRRKCVLDHCSGLSRS